MAWEAVLTIDAGTTGITVLLVDQHGGIISRGYREFPQHFPRPGWVEHDPEEIWQATLVAAKEVLEQTPEVVPIALGITNQRETFLFWDRAGGRPLHNAIVWQCRRSAAICDELRAAGLESEIRRKTGLLLDPYFSGTKALWLARERQDVAAAVRSGAAAFGTIDTWLAYRLSGGAHVTDFTNASRTLAFDIDRLDWDDGLLEAFALNRKVMPDAGPSAGVRAQTRGAAPIPDGLPIASLAGDQQAALFGQACFEPGQVKATYGTGCFILLNTGPSRAESMGGLLATLAASASARPPYALEGSIFIAGAAVQWCRDNMGFIDGWQDAERLTASVPDSGGVVFVPAFVGLGTPYWGPDARGAIYGLTRGTRPAHIVRAAVESMAYQAQDVLDLMTEESGIVPKELRVDGGAAANDFLMQLQADLAGVQLSRPHSVESTALGAAFLAGIATGFWKDETEVASLRREDRRFLPSADVEAHIAARDRWRAAIDGLLATMLPPFDSDAPSPL